MTAEAPACSGRIWGCRLPAISETAYWRWPIPVSYTHLVYSVEEINAPSGYTAVYSPDTGVTLTANGNAVITVTNTYTPDTWTLTYNANGGQNPPADNTVYSTANKVVSVKGQESMTYDGYTFLGWSATVHGVVTTAGGVPEALYNAGAVSYTHLWYLSAFIEA